MTHTAYLKKILCFLFIFALPIGGNWLFLYNHGELLPVEQIAKKQLAAPEAIAGLATRRLGYHYKQALYRAIKPKVLVLGSSRVMQFKQTFFSSEMVNAGGGMNTLNEGFNFLQTAFAEHIPELVVIGLDYWWFNSGALSVKNDPPQLSSRRISLRSYLLPYKWLYQKKITFKYYLYYLIPWNIVNAYSSNDIGVDGVLNKNGFSVDGSYIYAKTVSGKEKSIDEKFQQSLQRLVNGGEHFEFGKKINTAHFQQLLKIVDFLKAANIPYVMFIPPLAPSVALKMKEYDENFQFIADLKAKLKEAKLDFEDFHDGNLLGSDCEFIDGIHGGDIIYAKIMKALASKHSQLAQYINIAYLNTALSQYPHLAMIPLSQSVIKEVDFLNLGCVKT